MIDGNSMAGGAIPAGMYAEAGKPSWYTLTLQEYRRLGNPGRFEIFCLHRRFIPRDRQTAHKAYLAKIPEEVLAAAEEHGWHYTVENTIDFFQFTIDIRQGSQAERRKMIAHCHDIGREYDPEAGRIWYVSTSDFLPLYFEKMDEVDHEFEAPDHIRPPGAPLVRGSEGVFFHVNRRFGDWRPSEPEKLVDLIPRRIAELDDEEVVVRSSALFHLGRWTRTTLPRSCEGHDAFRPTREEGAALRRAWYAWWNEKEETLAD